jgi:integrase
MEQLGEVYTAIVKSWINADVIKDVNEVKKKHADVSKYIETKKTVNTRKVQYQALTAVLKQLKATAKIINQYSEASTLLAQEAEKKMGDNQVKETRRKHYKTYDELLELRDKLKSIDRNYTEELFYIILCFNTMIPPRRTELINTKLCSEKDVGNCIVKNKWYITEYKTKKTYGDYETTIPKELMTILKASLKKYPREYILTQTEDRKKPMTYATFWGLLYAFLGKGQSIDTLRSAYVSKHLPNLSYNETEELARQMATSVKMLNLAYRKL